MPETTTRPFTPEERARIEGTPRPGTPAQKRAVLALAFGLPITFVLHPVVHRLLPSDTPEKGLAVLVTSLAAGVVGGWLVSGRLARLATPAGFEALEARRRESAELDLQAGRAEVTRYRVTGAVRIDYGDGDTSWYLHLDDGTVLDLESDDVRDAIEEGRFPSREIEVARAAATDEIVSMKASGEPIEVDVVRGPLTDEEIEASEQRPDDREETWDEILAAARRHPYVPEAEGPQDRYDDGPKAPPQIPPDPIRPR